MDILTLTIENDPSSNRKIVNHKFKLLQTIGQGQFGKVLLAEDISSERKKNEPYVAIKTINRVDRMKLITKTYLSHTTKIKREIQIMKECNHPNVVKLYLVIDDLKFDKILLVLEYCKFGEIEWKKYNHYHEKYFKDGSKGITLNKILRDVVNGLEYLHTFKHIIHRDLKPSNLLICSDRTIKISDFGVSLILENNANDDKELGKTMGTPAFYAPELCQFVNNRLLVFNEYDLLRSKIDSRIDIWSLGVILYCLIFHQLPFEGFNEFGLFKNIVTGELKFPRTRESSHAQMDDFKELDLLKDLIRKLLAKEPRNRPTLTEIKNHGFTTFGMTHEQIETFKGVNREIISKQSPLAAESWAAESKLSSKIKKFFGARSDSLIPPTPPSALPLTVKLKPEPEEKVNIHELERVDDLLDSYLDDSSDMGSLEDEEPEVVDTANLLSSISLANSVTTSLDTTPTLRKSESSFSNSLRTSIPPPLNLLTSAFHSPSKIVTAGTPQSPYSGQKTPVTGNSSVVTIGPGSPLSVKSMFSPSRRFFLRLKKQPEAQEKLTINALSSPSQEFSTPSTYTDLAPPPSFGRCGSKNKRSSAAELIQSSVSTSPVQWGSRKNSMTSVRSFGLSKLSSSSSSLNLHAYLTDDNSSKWDPEDSDSEEEADRTLTAPPTMDQFLDRMD